MSARIHERVSRFIRDTKGDASLEAIIILPALLVIFAISWLYFDVMRQQAINQKANYTIGDIISRETEILDDTYVDNARNLLFHLAQAQGDDVDMRISVVQFNKNGTGTSTGNATYDLVWSVARGDWPALTQSDMATYKPVLPILAIGDQTIIVESRDWYQPLVQLANDGFDITTYSFTRPRFASQVIFEGENDGSGKTWQNNGWGNGDQDAPGGSLCNNNAENADEGAASTECTSTTTKPTNGKGKKKNT
ncbi:MAG: hypothetical protein JJ869_21470 [Marivita sp.]|uniref:TadE/TadG family type IV pilus assembly protein n=1 Tax=Marivita sp. TaxID=2003365 RepID=UPI001AFECBD4|nr:hypothetical protein [Marivita sp.]MBO6886123.1 hypothetical protein [Marivita sp.]